MRKLSYNSIDFIRKVIQKELDLHGAEFDYIMSLKDGRLPNGKFWYQHYVFDTEEQFEEWKQFCLKELRNTRERLSRRNAEKVFTWINLQYGLKQQYLHTWQTSQSAKEQDAD